MKNKMDLHQNYGIKKAMWKKSNGIRIRTKKFDKAHVPPTQTNKLQKKLRLVKISQPLKKSQHNVKKNNNNYYSYISY